MDLETRTPYCGLPPLPAELWSRWNLDPWLLAALLALSALLAWQARSNASRRYASVGAIVLLVLVFISPLCALASALFSARVVHHLILIAAIAPLLAIAVPWQRGPRIAATPLLLLSTFFVWLWHTPAPYAFALLSDAAYWLMQLSLLGSAWLLWRAVLSPQTPAAAALATLLGTVMQMGFLGALLVFLPKAVFAPHFLSTWPYGLSALDDQQLAGLLMWVPAVLPYLAVALLRLSAMLAPQPASGAR